MTIRRGYADGPFGQIHYCDSGGSGDALVLLHQAPLSLRQFDRVYPLFAAQGLRVIGIDLPGFGASDWNDDEPPSVEQYAEIVPAVLDHLAVESAHLCGHHTGAMVSTEASLRYPNRVLSLALSGPAPLSKEEQQEYLDTIVADERRYEPRADGSHLVELWDRRMAWLPERDDVAALCTTYILQPLMAGAPFWFGHQAAFSYDMAAALERVSHRTLVLANTTDMIYHLGKRTMAMRPDFHYSEVEGGGVDPTDFVTEPWTNAMLGFINGP
ncbi:MAG: alpha/beta fold hydrolase [Congregibacter sp.]